jgi:hypothetical protein
VTYDVGDPYFFSHIAQLPRCILFCKVEDGTTIAILQVTGWGRRHASYLEEHNWEAIPHSMGRTKQNLLTPT